MELPALLYGPYADVKKRCRGAIRRLSGRRESLWNALQIEGMLDTADHTGAIVIDPIRQGDNDNFHCYAPLYLVEQDKAFTLDLREAVFTSGLEEAWSLTCMLSRQLMYPLMRDGEHYRRYILAMLRHWDQLNAEGKRYAWASSDEELLWDLPIALKSALIKVGVPTNLVREPLPESGLCALLAQADPALAGDLVDMGRAEAASWRGPARTSRVRHAEPVGEPPEGTFMSEEMSAAVEANDPNEIRRLIEAGEPITAVHESLLRTPLLWAAEGGHTNLVRFLLDRGASIKDRADEGESPLMLAAQGGHRDTVRLLLDRGADPYYVTDKGFDVLHFAKRGGDAGVGAMLRALWAGKDPDFHYADPDEK